MIITCPIFKTSKKYPNRIALKDKNQTLTYKQLNERIEKYSLIFKSFNIQPGKRVAIFSKNSFEYVTSIFALIQAGVSFVPLNLRWSEAAVKNSIEAANCSFSLSGFENDYFSISGIKNYSFHDLNSIKCKNKANFSESELSTESELAVYFTSGSSGKPKGAILKVGNFYYSALGSNEFISLEQDDCWLASLPFYHVGGLAILFRCFFAEASVFILSDFDQQNLLFALNSQKITHISLVPSMLENLIDSGNIDCLIKLKCILLGGAPASENLIKNIKKYSLPVFTTYGMTETASQVTCIKLKNSFLKITTNGQILPFREVSILDENGKKLACNQNGEIVVRGDVLFRGYLNDGKKYDSNSWFKTGDLGYLDIEENLVLKGRKDDLIISGGENIFPVEIENVVRNYPEIVDCCVLGVEDSKWGQRPVLFVETVKPALLDKNKLLQFLKKYLSKLLLPDKVYVLSKFPQKAIGKIDKEKLLSLIEKNDHQLN